MIDPQKYADFNIVSHRDCRQCLEEYISKLTWNKDTDLAVIDIGSGDGSVTSKILQKYLPANFKELVGCDINKDMVQFATKHYASKRITFEILDIEGTLPEQFYNCFDYAFSFYVLQWVRNQKKALSNIYKLLAPGGSTLITIIGHQETIYSVYRILSQSSKWSKWLYNVENIVSPYHDSADPETKIRKMMDEIGFTDVDVACKKLSYCMGSAQEFKKFVRSLNAFLIPEEIFDDYLNEFVQIAQNRGFLDETFEYDYDRITIYAKKPKNKE